VAVLRGFFVAGKYFGGMIKMVKKKDVPEVSKNPLLGYDSHELLEAVDLLDDVRPVISDEGYNPPKIRIQLMKLHGMVFEMKNTGSLSLQDKKQFSRVMTLAGELDMEIFGCIENLEKINDMLGKLLATGRNEEWVEPDPEEDPEEME
jgi:hypothetical protein